MVETKSRRSDGEETKVSDDTDYSSYRDTRRRFDDRAIASAYVSKKNVSTRKNRLEMQCIEQALEGLDSNSLVLDLPCGSGRLEPMFLQKGFHVVAADFSRPMLDVAKQYVETIPESSRSASPALFFSQQDILNTGFKDDTFDAVVCNRLFHHYPEPDLRRAVLRELKRICKGRIIVSYYSNFALSALRFHLSARLRRETPLDRVPIWHSVFEADIESAGLRCEKQFPVRFGVSPQTYLRLVPHGTP
jgi:SAM-dependent methyltransferase